jgi:hypothetical protein
MVSDDVPRIKDLWARQPQQSLEVVQVDNLAPQMAVSMGD